MGAGSGDRLGRLALFLLCVVLLSLAGGVLISHVRFGTATPKTLFMSVSFISVVVGYLVTYSPGWLYKSLVDKTNDTSKPGGPK
jgi:hypothetical protein